MTEECWEKERTKEIYKAMMMDSVPQIMSDNELQIQGVQRIPRMIHAETKAQTTGTVCRARSSVVEFLPAMPKAGG